MDTRFSFRQRAAIRLQITIGFVALSVLSACSDTDVSEPSGEVTIASRFDDLNCNVSDLSGFSLAIPQDYVRQEIKAEQSTRVNFTRMQAQLEEGVVNATEFDSIYVYDCIRCINGRFPRRVVRFMIPERSLRRHSGPAATLRSPRPTLPAAAR